MEMFRWFGKKVLICLLVTLILKVFSEKVVKSELKNNHPEVKVKEEETVLSKFKNTRGYKYLMRLHKVLMEQLETCDEREDYSCRQWAIRAYMPDRVNNGSVVFRRSKLNGESPILSDSSRFTCVVSHVEYLLPVAEETKHSDVKIIINRQDLSSETASGIEGVTIFNLTRLRLGNNKPIHVVVRSPPRWTDALSHSVLYTFCNMNATVANSISAVSIATVNNDESEGMMGDDPRISVRTNEDKKTSNQQRKGHKICQKTPRRKKNHPLIKGGEVSTTTTTPAPKVDYQPQNEACKRHKLVIALDFFPPAFIVLHPRYYDVGQCKGMCAQVTDFCRLDVFRTGRALLLNRNVNRTHVNYVTCAPHKMSSMSIMYYMNNAFVTNVIPNASVRTCRCV